MNAALTTVASLLGVLIAIVGAYFAARSNARENRRLRNQEIADAVRAAVDPLNAAIAFRDQTILQRDRRIEQLEDQLRGGGTR